ncbi:MAG TPA: hypothetical protein VMY42_10735 [Thermoguttaceae bacterium]|nr:hypothetical protein [Thermoguttaceae bacterium]
MTNQTRRCWVARWLLPAVLAVGMGPMMAGCCSTPDMMPNAFNNSVRLPPMSPGSRAEAEAFQKQVAADQFPSGPMAKQ